MFDHVGLNVGKLAGFGPGDGAFVLDPDGNNVEAVCHHPVAET